MMSTEDGGDGDEILVEETSSATTHTNRKSSSKLRHSSSSRNVIKQKSGGGKRSLSRSKSLWSIGGEGGGKTHQEKTSSRRNMSISAEKAKLTHTLKTTQLEQNTKLQTKHQLECDLLDDIKNYAKQRSEIEKEYGNAMLKLAARFHKAELPKIITDDCDENNVPVMSAWKSILDATENTGTVHLHCSEQYKNNLYEPVKDCRARKEANLKKCQDVMTSLQADIGDSVKALTKSKKNYFETETLAQSCREKMHDVQEKLEKNHIGIFKSKLDLEKSLKKLRSKCEESERCATIARNNFLLEIASANAHQKRYFEVDIPQVIKVLDGKVYQQLRDFMNTICSSEVAMATSVRHNFATSHDKVSKVSREYDSSLFVRNNKVFEWGLTYTYEPCGNDGNRQLAPEHPNDDNSLNREARTCSHRIVRERRQLKRLRKTRQSLLARIDSHLTQHQQRRKSDTSGSCASLGGSGSNEATTELGEIDSTAMRLGKVEEDLRRVETGLSCAEARLQLLRDSQVVDVDKWMTSAQTQADNEDKQQQQQSTRSQQQQRQARRSTTTRTKEGSDGFIDGDDVIYDDDDFDETFDDWEDDEDDVNDAEMTPASKRLYGDDISLPSSDRSRTYPVSCIVNFPYQARRSDELTIEAGDKLEVFEEGDLDQWVKARDDMGREGYVPEYYLRFPHVTTSSVPPQPSGILGSSDSTTSGTSSLAAHSTVSSSSSHDVTALGESASTAHHHLHNDDDHDGVVCVARALYEYTAEDEDQLSFPEEAIIRVLRRDNPEVDDGWWLGEIDGRRGVFPSIVVQELSSFDVNSPVRSSSCNENVSSASKLLIGGDEGPTYTPPQPQVVRRSAPPSPSLSNNSHQNTSHLPTSSSSSSTRLHPPPPSLPSTLPRHHHHHRC